MSRNMTILNPGLALSIQDQGRSGYYHLGIPPSGAMDQYSSQLANLLVGNQLTDAVLECTLLGPVLKFNYEAVIAVTGGEMVPIVDGVPKETNTALVVPKDAEVGFRFMTKGARSYVAISGGINVPLVLGSRSFYSLGGIGGLNGKALAANDIIPIGEPSGSPKIDKIVPSNLRQVLNTTTKIRVIQGLYDHLLTKEATKNFYDHTWKVASEADRIGYRFQGTTVLSFKERKPPFGAGSDPSNIVDAPYPIGSIQVPSGKEPIILHRDAVSGGGYAMIATVISADMDLIGQLQPNYHAQFSAVTLDEALIARKTYQEKFEELNSFLH